MCRVFHNVVSSSTTSIWNNTVAPPLDCYRIVPDFTRASWTCCPSLKVQRGECPQSSCHQPDSKGLVLSTTMSVVGTLRLRERVVCRKINVVTG